ncbi:hypothetical protein F511_03834 [Dorcoceras hygrometricum]|uniref:Uncharacterized protein n=1 Tax=Dorcoceras hygrometricum TaxID=472368 RepID=A0A2Z7BP76_9LAMI|nr:hypothetical protein F511_03834 [Dorcoceras hygrometricum]
MSKPASPPSKSLNHSLHVFSIKLPPSSLTHVKHKTLLQTFVFSHVYRLARALTGAKSFLLRHLKDIGFIHFARFPLKILSKQKKKKKLFFGSFRLHYNWCSSHVMPVMQLDNTWSSRPVSTFENIRDDDELSGYLQWLEEKGNEMDSCRVNEIDKLADLFIADCHEKFRLEKQESYRRFQEMMARSI